MCKTMNTEKKKETKIKLKLKIKIKIKGVIFAACCNRIKEEIKSTARRRKRRRLW